MRISETIRQLEVIKAKFGDLTVVGGYLSDDSGMTSVSVVNVEGMEIFPNDPNCAAGKHEIDGVFLE